MYRFNRKAKQDVKKKQNSNDGSKNSKTSSGSSNVSSASPTAHQKRRQPKSDSESEKSLKNPRPKLIQPSPVVSVPKTSSPDRTKQKSTVQDMVKGVVNRITFTPNRKQQKSTSTPPTSEIRKVSDVRSDYVDSELEKQAKKSKSKGSISTSLSGSTESMISDFTKKPIQNKQIVSVPSKTIKSERSLIGLDGETEQDEQRIERRNSGIKTRQTSQSPSSRRDRSMEESASETKDSVSLADDEETREEYRKLFKDFAMASQKLTLDDFKHEFSQLPGDPPSDQCTAFNLGANNKKNRYTNIPCLDISRVRLQFMANKNNQSTDYIHANHIKSPLLKRGYILTQGPKKETIPDFWRMVWQEKSNSIVMLCQFVETNREKCVEYFPRNANATLRFDKLIVTFEEAIVNKSVVITRLNLSFEGETRGITHLQWKEWPDYQVPGSSEVMLKILRKIRARTHPPIIHCAAGVGRSGTLIAVEIALQSINTHFKLPDIKQVDQNNNSINNQLQIVTDLRLTGRATSVQTLQQYMLIWKVLLDFGVSNKLISEELVTKFSSTYRRSFRGSNNFS
ncbi:hypothetical protein GCK72_001854 [Caenorhabditis remanei]|uniref:Uncharacterized protein n=1 Tax=Caenorhabditis remanei TaxID=31234 RepID=A0A6A5HUS1_CAERE|nr:hypothetical protein GCK72_001854 [Caenorhabditis remanei]KAF1770037.1 hypothetical protein GCK72_001854 [Caenorhabditis remanei]